VQVFGPAFS
jgi:hypothetical protein